jgi:phospholipid/cholesterol/gamma-HCH transport system substrate-binding protein
MTDRFPTLKFGIFALLCLLAAAWLIQVTGNLRHLPFITPVSTFEAVLDDVGGLVVGDDVRLAGVPVGRVRGIEVERGKAVVRFEVDPDVALTDTWEIAARWRNVIGQRYLYLYPGDGGEVLADGARIPETRARRTADIGRFFNEITPLLRALDPAEQNKLLDALNTALVGREDNVQDLVRDLASLGSTVADQEGEIRRVLRDGSALLAEYNRREAELADFLTNLSSVGGVLAARNDELLAAVTDIGTVQAEIGDLVRRNDDRIEASLDNLRVITDTIGRQREPFQYSLAHMRDGWGTYMLISRWGQWFNVRSVAVQVAFDNRIVYCQDEAGDPCHEPNLQGPDGPGPRPPANRPGASPQPPTRPAAVSMAPERLPAVPVVADAALREGGA